MQRLERDSPLHSGLKVQRLFALASMPGSFRPSLPLADDHVELFAAIDAQRRRRFRDISSRSLKAERMLSRNWSAALFRGSLLIT
jgi:hypothetical protein